MFWIWLGFVKEASLYPWSLPEAPASLWRLLARSLSPSVVRAFPGVGVGVISFLWLQNGPPAREDPLSAPPSAHPFPSCPALVTPSPEELGDSLGAKSDLYPLLQGQGWQRAL